MHWPFQPDGDKGTRREGWGHKDTGVCVCMQAYLCVCTWHVCVCVSGCVCVCVSCYHGHLNQPVHPVLLSLPWYNQLPTPKHPLTTIPHSLHLSFSPHPSLLSSFVGFCHCATPSALCMQKSCWGLACSGPSQINLSVGEVRARRWDGKMRCSEDN